MLVLLQLLKNYNLHLDLGSACNWSCLINEVCACQSFRMILPEKVVLQIVIPLTTELLVNTCMTFSVVQ